MEPDEKAIQAAERALQGDDPTGGALYFYNPDISQDKWIQTLPVVTRIGNHVFATAGKAQVKPRQAPERLSQDERA